MKISGLKIPDCFLFVRPSPGFTHKNNLRFLRPCKDARMVDTPAGVFSKASLSFSLNFCYNLGQEMDEPADFLFYISDQNG